MPGHMISDVSYAELKRFLSAAQRLDNVCAFSQTTFAGGLRGPLWSLMSIEVFRRDLPQLVRCQAPYDEESLTRLVTEVRPCLQRM